MGMLQEVLRKISYSQKASPLFFIVLTFVTPITLLNMNDIEKQRKRVSQTLSGPLLNAAKTSRLAEKDDTDLWDSDSTEEATIETAMLELTSREEGRQATARTLMSGNTFTNVNSITFNFC